MGSEAKRTRKSKRNHNYLTSDEETEQIMLGSSEFEPIRETNTSDQVGNLNTLDMQVENVISN